MFLKKIIKENSKGLGFVKSNTLGNDFVLIPKEALANNVGVSIFIKEISDRRFGIGCDQVIVLEENNHIKDVNLSIFIYNSDGSAAKRMQKNLKI